LRLLRTELVWRWTMEIRSRCALHASPKPWEFPTSSMSTCGISCPASTGQWMTSYGFQRHTRLDERIQKRCSLGIWTSDAACGSTGTEGIFCPWYAAVCASCGIQSLRRSCRSVSVLPRSFHQEQALDRFQMALTSCRAMSRWPACRC